MYSKQLYVGWGDLDSNGHMRNTAFLDRSADVRMFFFSENGFPMKEFKRLGIGPVILKDTIEDRRECFLLEPIQVSMALQALSNDAARFVVVNEFHRGDLQLAARISSNVGWLDLEKRALTTPPAELAQLLRNAPRTSDFTEIPGITFP